MTVAHPERDEVAFRVESKLLADSKLGVAIRFSYPLAVWGPAVDDFSKAIEIAPKYSEAYSNRGKSFFAKKNYLKALEDYTKAIDFDPKNAGAYRNRADLYDKIGDKALAKTDRDKADEVEKGNK